MKSNEKSNYLKVILTIQVLTTAMVVIVLFEVVRSPENKGGAMPSSIPAVKSQEIPSNSSITDQSLLFNFNYSRGSKDAPNHLVVVSDYTCDVCRYWHQNVSDSVKSAFIDSGLLQVTYIPYSGTDGISNFLARSSQVAQQNGCFEDFQNLIYSYETIEDTVMVLSDLQSLTCLGGIELINEINSDKTVNRININRRFADDMGLRGLPFYVLNDQPINGYMEFKDISSRLQL